MDCESSQRHEAWRGATVKQKRLAQLSTPTQSTDAGCTRARRVTKVYVRIPGLGYVPGLAIRNHSKQPRKLASQNEGLRKPASETDDGRLLHLQETRVVGRSRAIVQQNSCEGAIKLNPANFWQASCDEFVSLTKCGAFQISGRPGSPRSALLFTGSVMAGQHMSSYTSTATSNHPPPQQHRQQQARLLPCVRG